MVHCTSCGQELPDSARFCSQCGTATGSQRVTGADVKAGSRTDASGDGQQQAGDPAAKIWTGWPSRKRHVPMLALSLGLVAGGLIGTAAGAVPLIAVAIVGGLGVLWTLGRMLIEPLTLRYWLTLDRLFIRQGLLRITTDQTELVRVDDIRVRQGLLDRIFGIGNVEVIAGTDATNGNVTLVGVGDPLHVAEVIRTGMQTQRRKRGMFVENV